MKKKNKKLQKDYYGDWDRTGYLTNQNSMFYISHKLPDSFNPLYVKGYENLIKATISIRIT